MSDGVMPQCIEYPVKRLLTMDEAAEYCGMGRESFLHNCPVKPKRIRPGQRGLRYDIRELDVWIDSLGGDNGPGTADATDWLVRLDGTDEDKRRQSLR
jgi:predicted DNA-binding transcriptional regulator AlpA